MKSSSIAADNLLRDAKKQKCPGKHKTQKAQMSGVISSKVTAAVPQTALSDPRRSTLACILGFSLAFLVACSFLTYKPVSHGLNLPFYPSTPATLTSLLKVSVQTLL